MLIEPNIGFKFVHKKHPLKANVFGVWGLVLNLFTGYC
jgi:hypothetical protein